MDKKLGLEHTIRNIMVESVGAIGTDKFTKTGNSFFKSFHAEPKIGDSHPNGNAIRAARNASKERTSETMSKVTDEEQIDEFVAPPVRVKVNPPSAPEIPVPKVEPKTAPPVEVPEPKPAPTPEPTPAPKPAPAPESEPAPAPKPASTPAGASQPAPTSKPGLGSVPAPGTGSKPAPAAGPKPAPGSPPAPKTNTKVKTDSPKSKFRFPIMPFPLAIHPLGGAHGRAPVNTYLHTPQERFGESTEADNIRRSIENVARPNSKNKLTKQAEIKTKIIDETTKKANIIRDVVKEKKAGANPLVDTKPKLKGLEIDERFLGRAAAVGTAGVAGYGGALEKPKELLNKYKSVEDQEKALKGQKDFLGIPNERYGGIDTVLDLTSMLPFAGTPSALYSAKRSFDRGDYVDTALNLASAIPGVGTGIKAAKFLGKGVTAAGKAIQKGGTVASDVASGVQLGDIPYQVDKISQETGMNRTDIYKDIANTMYSDIKKDVVEPVTKKVKSSIEVFGGPTSSASGKKLNP